MASFPIHIISPALTSRMTGNGSLWPSEGNLSTDVLWSIFARTGFILPTLVFCVAYLAVRYPDRVPGIG